MDICLQYQYWLFQAVTGISMLLQMDMEPLTLRHVGLFACIQPAALASWDDGMKTHLFRILPELGVMSLPDPNHIHCHY